MQHLEWDLPDGTRGLIFDCDGTLADTMPVHFRAWTAMLGARSMTFAEERFFALAGMPSTAIIRLLGAEQSVVVTDDDIVAMVADKEQRYVSLIDEVSAIGAVLEIAARFRGVLPLAVASGGDGWVVRRTLEAIGATDWFDTIVGAEDTERHKPEPDVFLEAAARIGVDPGACVVFEDSDLGLEAARRAGMRSVDVRAWV